MLSREGRRYMELAPRLALWPGLFLTVTVYCLNMVGDAVRDLLDPRLRGRMGRFGGAKLGTGRRGSELLVELTIGDQVDGSRSSDSVRRVDPDLLGGGIDTRFGSERQSDLCR